MGYELVPTEVSVAFYDRSSCKRGKLIKYLTLTDIHHCSIILHRKEGTILLACDKTHKAKFVSEPLFHESIYSPNDIIKLGVYNVSLEQLMDFIRTPYIGDARSLAFWFTVGRYLLPKVLPPSCALITSYLLRLCGIPVRDHIQPKTLYKELTNANYSNCWTGWVGKDITSPYNNQKSL